MQRQTYLGRLQCPTHTDVRNLQRRSNYAHRGVPVINTPTTHLQCTKPTNAKPKSPKGTTDLGGNAKDTSINITCNKNAPAPKGPPIGMVVPLYVDPGPVWQRLATSAKAHPHDVEITAIISPNHGDNNADMAGDDIPKYLAHNKTWLDGMQMLRDAGIKIQHYFHLRNLTCPKRVNGNFPHCSGACCVQPDGSMQPKNRCCNSLENISAIVNASLTYFPEDGFFQDNGPWVAPAPDSSVSTLAALRAYEEAAYNMTQGRRGVAPGNEGASGSGGGGGRVGGSTKSTTASRWVTSNGKFDAWALQTLNESIVFETSIPQVRPVPTDARALYPRWRFATIACGVKDAADMRMWADKFLDAGYGSICLLQLMTGVHMYDNLPDFWEEEVAYLASKR